MVQVAIATSPAAMNAARVAKFRARRRHDRGRAAHNRLKEPDVSRLFSEDVHTVLMRLSPLFTGELTELQVLFSCPRKAKRYGSSVRTNLLNSSQVFTSERGISREGLCPSPLTILP